MGTNTRRLRHFEGKHFRIGDGADFGERWVRRGEASKSRLSDVLEV